MIHFRTRRTIGLWIASLVGALAFAIDYWFRSRLGNAAIFSGATLFATLLLLVAIGLRKRLVMLPLWSVSSWVQIHIYSGLFSLVVYGLHVPRVIANGMFEGGLSLLFLTVSCSGLYGLFVSRTAPRKMTSVPGDYRFDRIPWHRQRLAESASDILSSLDASLASPVLATYYRDNLQPYFASRVPLAFLAVPNGIRRRRMLSRLAELNRYLSEECRAAAGQLAALVRTRDELDFHFAIQLRLRLWVAVHAILSMILVIWSLLHVLLVYHFL